MTRKIGLALGSGGVKGIAHIGVLQVLEENAIPIHVISGCSAGAIIGAIYAVGTDLNMLGKFFSVIEGRDMLDVTLPRAGKGGLFKGERMQELIRVLTHSKTFEQADIPFYCVAVDLETGELVTFREGMLHEAVRASMSIPGVFMPVRVGGKLYVDGGLLERVPSTPLREAGADVIIGVDVGYRGELAQIERPTTRSIVDRTMDIAMWEIARLRQDHVDVMITPQVRELMKGFSTAHTEECIAEGRRAAEEMLPRIWDAIDTEHK